MLVQQSGYNFMIAFSHTAGSHAKPNNRVVIILWLPSWHKVSSALLTFWAAGSFSFPTIQVLGYWTKGNTVFYLIWNVPYQIPSWYWRLPFADNLRTTVSFETRNRLVYSATLSGEQFPISSRVQFRCRNY